MRVLFCGSRSWNDIEAVANIMQKLPKGTVIIHGDARGADTIADVVARELGFEVLKFPVTKDDWEKFGKGAGHRRNKQMLDEGGPNLVVAFVDLLSTTNGTSGMIDLAETFGVRAIVTKKYCWPENCTTCNQPYTGGSSLCSNTFHCCRDCTWLDGRVTVSCERHGNEKIRSAHETATGKGS